ncbi:MAG: type II secretion system F family protein [Candidatus Omnitrophota bacterium]|jgi:tight adherence protein B
MTLFFGYALLVVAILIFSYYGITIALKRYDEAQKKKADEASAQFEEMFIFLNKRMLLFLFPISALSAGALAYILTKQWWMGLIFLAVGAIIPGWMINLMDKRRRQKFILQLVDGLMVMNSCLKGGLTLVQSFEILSEEMAPPLSHEISLLNREIKVGVTLEEALLRLEKRMPSEEMTLITSAILVARETGGDLTKVFSRLVETIRDRIKLREMVTTLTLQARLQSIIISMLGPVFFVVVRKIRPDHFDIMWRDELGRIFLLIAIGLQILGIILIIIFGKIEI